MKIISVQTMRELDRKTIESGTPAATLMSRAGEGVYETVMELLKTLHPRFCERLVILAGKGNNGGDAFVVAHLFAERTEFPVTVYSVAPVSSLKNEARHFAETLPETVQFRSCAEGVPDEAFLHGTVVIDGLLGTGISGPLKEPYADIIKKVNNSRAPVVSIDIPSGMNGDTGEVATAAVQADMTAVMAFPKRGMMTENGFRYSGCMRCVDIGIPAHMSDGAEGSGEAIFECDAASLLPARPVDLHKGSAGHVLIVGGSRLYTGAPVLAGTAALRSGSGLVLMAVPESVRSWFGGAPAALVFQPLADNGDGFLNKDNIEELDALKKNADSIVVGPGIGRREGSDEVVQEILSWPQPVIVDADALKIIADNPHIFPDKAAHIVLTPHPGEMRALLKAFDLTQLLESDRHEQAVALARRVNATVVLKGLGTVIADSSGNTVFNTSGTNALSSAGTGDVLAGLIGGFAGQIGTCFEAAQLGTFIHGRASEVSICSRRALIADDLLENIAEVFNELSPNY